MSGHSTRPTDCLTSHYRQLEEEGFGFRSLTEGIETTTASGTLVFHVFGALAQFERDLIRERTMAGLVAARARGRRGGRPGKLTPELRRQAEAMLKDARSATSRSAAPRSITTFRRSGSGSSGADGGEGGRRSPEHGVAQG